VRREYLALVAGRVERGGSVDAPIGRHPRERTMMAVVATADAATKRPADMQKLVNAWYATLDYIKANPDEARKIMAKKADLSTQDYADLEKGTTIFSAEQAAAAFADRAGDPSSLPEMTRRINPFLVSSGLAQKEADVSKLFMPAFTAAYLDTKK